MKHIMIWLVRLYRKYISPLKPPCCRFTPTCSAYAIEAFQKRGFFAGLILTVWRILRCNPFGKGGYDPVPDRGFKSYSKCRENQCEKHTHTDITEKEKEN
nr:membrane protein insertion efficiency factor YidD [Oscillospiraceae bacterium]